MQAGLLIDTTRCIGCNACAEACKEANGLPAEIEPQLTCRTWTRVREVKRTFVRQLCMHCEKPSCASVCPVGALYKSEKGPVAYDENKCIGCGFCTWACPFNAPQLTALAGKMQKCNFCQTPGKTRPLDMPRACEEVCPTGAIKSGSLVELAKLNREKAAAKLGSTGMQGFPSLMVEAHQRYGPGAVE